jgi:hypothetical protein
MPADPEWVRKSRDEMCNARHNELTQADIASLEQRFTYHKPFGDQPVRYEALRAKAKELAALISGLCPISREMSLALTKVEEACFWANAAIARNEKEKPDA